jgi:hypothetical protein
MASPTSDGNRQSVRHSLIERLPKTAQGALVWLR